MRHHETSYGMWAFFHETIRYEVCFVHQFKVSKNEITQTNWWKSRVLNAGKQRWESSRQLSLSLYYPYIIPILSLYCSYTWIINEPPLPYKTCTHASADITLSPLNRPAGGHSRACLLVYEPEALAAVHKEEDERLCPRGSHQQQGSETHFIAGEQCREGCPVALNPWFSFHVWCSLEEN